MNHVAILNHLSFKTSGKLLTCALLVALADMLFYNHPVGWTLGPFGMVLRIAMQLHHPSASHSRIVAFASYAVAGLTFALMETPSAIAVTMIIFSMITLALLTKLHRADDVRIILKSVLRYMFTGWWRIYRDGIIMETRGDSSEIQMKFYARSPLQQ